MQIVGSTRESNQEQRGIKKGDDALVSDNGNGFSASPIIVNSRKDASDILN